MNYYNEIDSKAAAWLQELINDGQIPNGHIDTRSISDVIPSELRGYTQCHFFAGIGGWSLALRLAGWPDSRPVWTGSCPCQPFSSAGKGLGFADERNLWPDWMHLIRQCRPTVIFGEQVASAIRHGWLDLVFDDLENSDYACGAANIPAASVGAPHLRERVWFVGKLADGDGGDARTERKLSSRELGLQQKSSGIVSNLPNANEQQRDRRGLGQSVGRSELADCRGLGNGLRGRFEARHVTAETSGQGETAIAANWDDCEWIPCTDEKWRPTQPGIFPLVDGLPRGVVHSGIESLPINATPEARTMRIKGYGNAIVPQVATEFIRSVM